MNETTPTKPNSTSELPSAVPIGSSAVLGRQRIEQMIESYHDLWIKNSIEAVQMKGDSSADYKRGLSQGCAIAYEGFVRNLRELRDEWRPNI